MLLFLWENFTCRWGSGGAKKGHGSAGNRAIE